jgi:hypothetical protein
MLNLLSFVIFFFFFDLIAISQVIDRSLVKKAFFGIKVLNTLPVYRMLHAIP